MVKDLSTMLRKLKAMWVWAGSNLHFEITLVSRIMDKSGKKSEMGGIIWKSEQELQQPELEV